ncbi:hypothetical protein TgHK011_001898 [Trichoderma gracile]|nr:hypothetical protein TgHK011_001898 [Trichoderma gracile]
MMMDPFVERKLEITAFYGCLNVNFWTFSFGAFTESSIGSPSDNAESNLERLLLPGRVPKASAMPLKAEPQHLALSLVAASGTGMHAFTQSAPLCRGSTDTTRQRSDLVPRMQHLGIRSISQAVPPLMLLKLQLMHDPPRKLNRRVICFAHRHTALKVLISAESDRPASVDSLASPIGHHPPLSHLHVKSLGGKTDVPRTATTSHTE